MEKYIFYAEVDKGNVIKVLIDILSGQLSRTVFMVSEKGISITDSDSKNTICYNANMERENFKKFHCDNPINFSFNLKHVNRLIKNVKKKDHIVLFTERDHPDSMAIQIFSDSSTAGRLETNKVVIQQEIEEGFKELPDKDLYHHPIPINSSDFQKIKKQTVFGNKVITIRMIRDKYISFNCSSADVYSSKLEFGADDPEADAYEADFSASLFSNLVKLPGLSPQIQVYCPREEAGSYPILIRSNISTLGKLDVFIKDRDQIAFENSQ
mgnify:CR=1 FL=1